MEQEDPMRVPNAEARTSTGFSSTEGTLDLEEVAEAILKYEGVFELTSMQEVTEREKQFSDQEQKVKTRMSARAMLIEGNRSSSSIPTLQLQSPSWKSSGKSKIF